MHHTRRGPRSWKAWVLLILLGGLLMLEPQVSLSSGGHQIVQLAMILLMFGVVLYWLRHNRGALINEVYEREQKESVYKTVGKSQKSAISGHEPWDVAGLPRQNNGHSTDIPRRR